MSVRLPLSVLTSDQKDKIRKCLNIQPKKTNWAAQNHFCSQTVEPVQFYYVDKPNDQIVLPYTFGNSLVRKHINSQRKYPHLKYQMKTHLYENQKAPIEEALVQLKNFGTTTLNLPTAFGKSVLAAYLGSQLGGLVLILFNRETIKMGFVKTFAEFTDAKVWNYKGKNAEIPHNYNVILSMEGVLHKLPKEIIDKVSVLIVDEAHMFCVPSQVHNLLLTRPKHIILLTATLERRDEMERMLFALVGTHKVKVESQKRYAVYRLATGIKKPIVKNKQGTTDWSKLVHDLSMDPKRNAFIIDLVQKNKEHKIMILTWTKKHVDFLTEVLEKQGVEVDQLSGTKSNFIDRRVLVGTISKVGTGFDAKMASEEWRGRHFNMLMLVGSTKSIPLLTQLIGRSFRAEFPVIIDFVDDMQICKSHWRTRKKKYENENCEINYIEMDKTVLDQKSKNDTLTNHQKRLEKFKTKNKSK